MWISPIKLVSCRNYLRNVSLIRFFTVSTLSQFETSPLKQLATRTDNNMQTGDRFIELDSVKVVQALSNLRKEPNLALTFFNQLKDGGFSHDVSTYAAVVRILCYWHLDRKLISFLLGFIKKESNFDIEIRELFQAVVDGVEIESERSKVAIVLCDSLVKASVNVGMFYEAIDVLFQINCYGFAPNIFSCNFLMNRLIECGKVDMAVAIYRQLKKIGVSANDYTYTIAIKAFCVKGNLEEAVDVFQQMEKDGVTPNEFAYTTYIEGLCKHGGPDLGFEVVQSLITNNAPISVFAYTVVIHGFCNEMKLDKAENAFLEMEKQCLIPDMDTYGALISGHIRAGNLLKAMAFHDEMISRGIKTNCVIVSSILQGISQMCMASEVVLQFRKYEEMGIFLDEACYNIAMGSLCKHGEVEKAAAMLVEMKQRRILPDILNYTTLINGYFLKGKVCEAFNLFKEMKDSGHAPDIISYNVLAGGLARNGLAKEVVKLLDYMKAQGLEPNIITHNMIIKGLCTAGRVEQAKAFFDNLEEKCLENYSSLVLGYCEANCTKKAFELFINLSKHGVIMNRGSCWRLLCNLCTEGDHGNAFLALETMLALGIHLTKFMYGKLIGMLCQAGKLEMARSVFDFLIREGSTPDMITYTMMINGYCRGNRLREAGDLLSDMKNRGIKPDVVTYTVLLGSCSKIESRNCFLSEMSDMGIPADVICYTVLIDKHCKANNIQDAVSLFNEMIDQGLEPDTVTYTALLAGFFRVGDNDKAEIVVDLMSDKGIQLDTRAISTLEYGISKAIKKSDYLCQAKSWKARGFVTKFRH